MNYKIFFLPIETKNREFLGKLLTAATATQDNWMVFLGQAPKVRKTASRFIPGVYSEISIPEYKHDAHLLHLSRAGHKIVNICEESVTYPEGRDYCDRKVGQKPLKLVDKFFASGYRHAGDVEAFRSIDTRRLPITGSPRVDVLRAGYREAYASQARRIRKELDPFILINTNFARCNPHPNYGNRLAGLKDKKIISSAHQVKIWQGSHDYKAELMSGFMKLIPLLADRYQLKAVIRPHPSENHDRWHHWAEQYNNILIKHDGCANEWMMAARATIHNGCTTGLEGFMLERPVIAYVPDPENDYSRNIANEVSHQTHDKEELFAAVEKSLHSGRLDSAEERTIKAGKLKHYIENVDGPLASERIVEELNTIDVPSHSLDDILRRARGRNSTKYFFFSACKDLFKKGLNTVRKSKDSRQAKVLQKFPGLSEKEIMESLLIWHQQGLLPSMPRVVSITDNLFCLYQEKVSV
ncbi:surface carbohydrate biosynthesis protein [Desulfonatronospira sp.]|uniref:surface carbohydrate biosynthesis protein n=1 Tax=Desulfonatronospira sp. TaxID=1962951 RepID=UPI0025B916B7|nr:surface carbohydrate biosynthesis protein [Desulfonatronospira sp.]